MTPLFRREVHLLAGGKDLSGLRIQFRASKSLQAKPNAMELAVYNLSRETIAAASAPGAQVMLSAGYEGASRLIFLGDMDSVTTERSGADWVTRMQAGDGLDAARLGRRFEAMAKGLKVGDLVERMAGQMSVAAEDAKQKIRAEGVRSGFESFVNGLVTQGSVHEQFNRIAEAFGYDWTVQDGALVLLREGEGDGRDAVVLSADTGLVGSPVLGKQPTPTGGVRDVLKLRSLLNGDIQPGRVLKVQAQRLEGWWVCESVQHVGDTHGQDWYSDVEAVPL